MRKEKNSLVYYTYLERKKLLLVLGIIIDRLASFFLNLILFLHIAGENLMFY